MDKMNKQEQIENNILIAKFMGWEIRSSRAILHGENGIIKALLFENLNFHSDWNEFMDVCKRIDTLGEDDGYWFSDMYAYLCDRIDNAITRNYTIEHAYPFVIEFIQWYYEEKAKSKTVDSVSE